eukprot:evm.model.NODE_38400_length_6715_cov_52.424423.2
MEVVFQRAHEGAKACKAFATLIQQTAVLEEGYGNSVVKVGESFASIPEAHAPSLSKATAGICISIQSLGRQHLGLASTLTNDVCRSLVAYADQQHEVARRMVHEVHVLVEEVEKERTVHRKVREKYRKACKDAEKVLKKGQQQQQQQHWQVLLEHKPSFLLVLLARGRR